MFVRTICEAFVNNDALLLCSERESLTIPLDSVQQFTVYGSAADPKQYMLVTEQAVYHGDFPAREDMEQMLDALKCVAGLQIEISLNKE